MTTDTLNKPVQTPTSTGDERVAHLVLKTSWPIALCGATVRDHLGAGAPGMDRCPVCIKIAADRKMGRPGWIS